MVANAQENSPYSRYGFGNQVPSTPIVTRGMGGITTGYVDFDERYDVKEGVPRYLKPQAINFMNPASYARLRITSFDLGFELENQVLQERGVIDKYKSSFANVSYLQLGIPVSRKHNLGMVLGLRPVTRINYKIQSYAREVNPDTGNSIDSTLTTYEGKGGSYQAYVGLGKAIGNFAIGANLGYYFGTKDFGTRKSFLNDSVNYYKSNYQTKISFGGAAFHLGAQYRAKLSKTVRLVLGATATLESEYDAKKDIIRETFEYDQSGASWTRDSVYRENDVKGTVIFPVSYSGGISLEKLDKWLIGAEYTTTSWDDFRLYDSRDSVGSTYRFRFGGQFIPNAYGSNYWGRVIYRAGFNYGTDYIRYGGEELKQYAVTAGFGLPVRPNRYSNQYTILNLALEYGRRGNADTRLQESQFRISLGATLSDLWFVKRKYD
ncbi:MAG TPA: hypothetical protein VIK80_04365 [Flavihumibacter sp.]